MEQGTGSREATTETRIARVIARLPRLLTEADDYSWVPLGDVLVAVIHVEDAEAAWPEGEPPLRSEALLRYAAIEAAARAVIASCDYVDGTAQAIASDRELARLREALAAR